MSAPHAYDCPAADRLVDDAIRAIGAEIAALDEKISEAHGALLGGVERVHAAQDALHTVAERQRNRQENRERIRQELAEGEERLEELNRLAAESGKGSDSQSEQLQRQTAQLAQAREAEEAARKDAAEKEEKAIIVEE